MEKFKISIVFLIVGLIVQVVAFIFVQGIDAIINDLKNKNEITPQSAPQMIEVITYDTLSKDNAHVSIVSIDSAKYVVVKYGRSVAIAPHKRGGE
jgi:hypothetical protein